MINRDGIQKNSLLPYYLKDKIIKPFLYGIQNIWSSFFNISTFGIDFRYKQRKKNAEFSDIGNTEEWQKEVYEKAHQIYISENLKSVIDIGCGSGYKLLKYFSGIENKIGIDNTSTVSELRKLYPEERWLESTDLVYNNLTADLIICADVLEHIANPDLFCAEIKKIKNVKYLIFSTPERTLINNASTFGPPNNQSHFREWNFNEFKNFISSHFILLDHFISNKEQGTQCVVVCPTGIKL